MALEGYFLFQGDRTVCGGKIITGAEDTEFFGRSQARESDKVTCGKHPGIYRICGGMGDMYEVGGVNRQLAGSIESYSSCRVGRNSFRKIWITPTNITAMPAWLPNGRGKPAGKN